MRGSPVNPISIVASVLAKARKYRKLTRMIDDRETARRILELIEELKQGALALAKPDEEHIRVRAREIWDEKRAAPGERRGILVSGRTRIARSRRTRKTRW